jgi:phosphoserine phosphatase
MTKSYAVSRGRWTFGAEMGDGKNGPPGVVFCDLDGTLILDNSFHMFLRSAWHLSPSTQRLFLGASIAMRLLGAASGGHSGLKQRALSWFARQDASLRMDIVRDMLPRLAATLSAPVVREIQALRDRGFRVVLATAAPHLYADEIAGWIGADECLASLDVPGPDWRELLGQRKAAACQAWLERQPARPACVVVMTDHPDDLPLVRMADRAAIQTSSRGFEAIAAAVGPHGPQLEQIDVFAEQENGGYWLWFDDRPEGPLDQWEVRTVLSKHRHALLYAGDGRWRRIGPGQPFQKATRRRECPRPPRTNARLVSMLRRRIVRDWFGIFH